VAVEMASVSFLMHLLLLCPSLGGESRKHLEAAKQVQGSAMWRSDLWCYQSGILCSAVHSDYGNHWLPTQLSLANH